MVAYATAVDRLKTRFPEADPRNWVQQTGIHENRCPHKNWFFLPWHRAYLNYFEQLCQEVLGDANFALPYWDWTQSPRLPAPFADPASPLFIAGRNTRINLGAPVQRPSIDRILRIESYSTFGSGIATVQRNRDDDSEPGPGELEIGPHNHVHGQIGGEMGDYRSPLDPIFWLHHNNIDRLWDSWVAGGRQTSTDQAYQNYVFRYDAANASAAPAPPLYATGDFVDRAGARVAPSVRMMVDSRALGYAFDRLERPAQALVSAVVLPQGPIEARIAASTSAVQPIPLVSGRVASVTVPLGQRAEAISVRAAAAQGAGPANARKTILDRIPARVSVSPQAVVGRATARIELSSAIPYGTEMRVFVNFPDVKASTSTTDPHYVATISSFGHAGHGGHKQKFNLDITEPLARISNGRQSGFEAVTVQLVPIGEDPKLSLLSVAVAVQ